MTDSDATRSARGRDHADFTTAPSVPPIFQTAAFDLRDVDHLQAMVAGDEHGHIYTRESNPNHEALAATMAELEGAESAVVCSSGMGAMAAAILAQIQSGDHIVAARVHYGGTTRLFRHLESAFGVGITLVDATRPGEFASAVTDRTRLAVVETLSNPLLEVADLPAIVEALGTVPLLVDSTFTPPSLLKPIEHGARYSFHSGSKYLNGHGDVMLGVVAGPADDIARMTEVTAIYGMNANPMECWLAARGLRTLPLRMEQVSRTASRLAMFLESHPAVERTFYPGLESHPSHELAKSLLPHGCSGMMSFEMKAGDRRSLNRFMQNLDSIPFSPTLADARTTISHPASTSHRYLPDEERRRYGVTDGLIRLSVGLEDADDLQRELDAALRAV